LKNFDLIVFDWDGTLFDSTAIITRCIQYAISDLGGVKPSDKDASYVIGMGLTEALAHAAPDIKPEQYDELTQRYRHHYLKLQDDISLFDGIIPVLKYLKSKGLSLAVATGKTRRGLEQVLKAVELRGIFDGSRTADETRNKPNPKMLHELIQQFNTTPERTLMVGDTTHDLEMASNAGCPCVGVSYGAHQLEDLKVWSPLIVVNSVGELSGWLRDRV